MTETKICCRFQVLAWEVLYKEDKVAFADAFENWIKIGTKNDKVEFVVNHPIRYFFENENPPIYYAKVNLKEKIKDSEKILGELEVENKEKYQQTLSDLHSHKLEGKKTNLTREEVIKLWQEEKWETKIEVYQPPKDFYNR